MSPVKVSCENKYRLPGFEELNDGINSEDSVTIKSPDVIKNKSPPAQNSDKNHQ